MADRNKGDRIAVANRVRIGVVGLGMGRHHARWYSALPQAELAALCDLDEGLLAEYGALYPQAETYTSYQALFESGKVDAVSVALPNVLHAPVTIAALRAGLDVLCEKPMAINAQQAEEMAQVARETGRKLMIHFNYRFTKPARFLKRYVEEGHLGELYYAKTRWLRTRGIPKMGGWFGIKELSGGGPLIDLGVHRLDLALWLMGYPKPAWVMGGAYDPIASALAQAQGVEYDVEDLAVAMIRFENGAMLAVEASWAANIQERELMETRLLGTQGGLVQRNLDEGYEFEAEIYLERAGAHYDMKLHAPPRGRTNAMQHFIESIVQDVPHMATGEEGLLVMEILDAIYESAAKGAPVQIG
jgi:predicted dehydrogenase